MSETDFNLNFSVVSLVVSIVILVAVVQMKFMPFEMPQPGRIAPPEIKAAMQKVGPLYHYRVLHDGTLQVNRGQGWERVRY